MTGISFDTSELRTLSADLAAAPESAAKKVPAILGRGAKNIRDQMRSEAEKSRRYFKLGYTIDYEKVREEGTSFSTEIGPNRARHEQAKLAHVAYFGGVHGGGGTLPDPQGALDAEAPEVMKYLAREAADVF
ncbi:hypothetical protein GCM10009718_33270 [Isoptericola halotolerans]|uniref:HK97 gp10 family phage protein n=1 Tax=Isoptericola halotolerans TaxID=300560 RepID=A0ABX2A5S9_9MICO|nr:hypothetical protein [Isoptericola halotolerans]NOV98215.1 hypothetical protein [Isoptericola halotolerans]